MFIRPCVRHVFAYWLRHAVGAVILLLVHQDASAQAASRLYWQHQQLGYLAAWDMNGTNLSAGMAITPSQVTDTDWKIVGTGDFNGDGQLDLFWQHQVTRLMTVWLMNGATFVAAGMVSPNTVSDARWRIRAIADMNGDGNSDLVWQNDGPGGQLAVWFMNGTTLLQGQPLVPPKACDNRWKIVGAADFDGDGHTDLLWHHGATGELTTWLMDQHRLRAQGVLTNSTVSDPSWKVRALVDMDGNGSPDIVWQHEMTGRLALWLMNGTTFLSGQSLTPDRVTDLAWRIVGSSE